MKPTRIGIIGAGGWGTALGIVLNRNGHNAFLWTHDTNLAHTINRYHVNKDYLPNVILPQSISATNDASSLIDCDLILNTIPTQYIRSTIKNFSLPIKNKPIVNGSKGIETESLKRISEIFYETVESDANNFTVLTGPSHAEEVSREMPTTVVAASENIGFANSIQEIFSNDRFRVYSSNDVVGCEMGGSLKNVIALAAGIIDGLELGDNTKAALITRGLAEMSRLGTAMGANPLTFSGLSGLGDLIVTCNSKHSRNRYVGEMIGRGKKLNQIIEEMKMIAEGVKTTESAYHLGIKHNVEMPIAEQIFQILFNDVEPLAAIKELMTRTSKNEWWW
ncbi:MAG: NAD(P)H-dependent glycerol-3-phosphate dehydrogenase [Candidatus Kapabacteria bacterium]|nr:NAD(P)H-dependent glycerol-3-phosphate dehydrogenase [Candidatus Kapabacteria bacterium]